MSAQDTLKQPFPYSLPKEKIKILLLEGISETAVGVLRAAGYTAIDRRAKALDGPALREALQGVRLLGIRSRTQISAEVIDGIRSLVAIGCFSVGTNAGRSGRLPHDGHPGASTRRSRIPVRSPS
jgi:D-3-phosphoglycerate dehydrogenase